MNSKLIKLLTLLLFTGIVEVNAQTNDFDNPTLIHYFNPQKSRYIQFSGYAEIWARYGRLNPGSLVNNEQKDALSDLSLRRIRAKMTYKPTENLMMVLQAGPSNVNVNAKSNTYMDLLDAYAEYKFNKYISIGGGRSTWRGLTRFSTGPMATLLYDMPAFATANAGVTDVTVRMMSIYAKGAVGNFDYRVAIADPYTDAGSAAKLDKAVFNTNATNKLFTGYVKYQFLDKENNSTPFSPGTYLGKKKVLNIGVGAEYLKDALWHLDAAKQTHLDNMESFATDVFYDTPIDKRAGTSFSFYGMAMHNNYGPNYLRMVGTNNPATGVDPTMASLNGAGNAYPVTGTGNTFYVQAGGTLPYFNKEKKGMQLLPAASVQYSKFDALNDPAVIYDAGVSLLFNGHSSKLTFDAQSRPIYNTDAANEAVVTDRKWTFLLKYRIDFN
ncbi:hypothetical protein [Pedobacter antarcticus]|uniref:hypothetical protein n=1 Tax=Pedobacter antarcticus TaxID=34086 RepID=UPI00292EDD68|nr:hypothetical protein [Pedobacter antarcticus]